MNTARSLRWFTSDSSPDDCPCEIGGALLEVDWHANFVWEHYDRNQHHDGRCAESGGAIYLTLEQIPENVSREVRGGIETDEPMWADLIIEVDKSGNRIWEWHAYEHLDYDTHILPLNVPRHEWSHANTLVPISEERLLVSFRHISTIAIIDKSTGNITWSIGHETVSGQHDASMLPNGNNWFLTMGFTEAIRFLRSLASLKSIRPRMKLFRTMRIAHTQDRSIHQS